MLRSSSLRAAALAVLFACAVAVPAAAAPRPVDRPAARAALAHRAPVASAAKIRRPRWINRVEITEYYPIPERFFVGRRVKAPGIPGLHRIDWLYSARGLTMEGDGIGLDRRRYHVDNTGRGGWVDKLGHNTCIGCSRGVFWRAGGFWRNQAKRLTFPLDGGGWFNGLGVKYVPLPGVSFASGPSLNLTYYASLAVDPDVIPMGSRIYIPWYRTHHLGTGWFKAQDTGGAIGGRHVDVYRPPPATLDDEGNYLTGQRIYVVPPGKRSGITTPTGGGGGSTTGGGGGSTTGGGTTTTGGGSSAPGSAG